MKLREVLGNPEALSTLCWLYLPRNEAWRLDSEALVMEEDEVTPEEDEADPQAGIPREARERGMTRALDIATVQDIVFNAREQKPMASESDLMQAFLYYLEHDAFLKF